MDGKGNGYLVNNVNGSAQIISSKPTYELDDNFNIKSGLYGRVSTSAIGLMYTDKNGKLWWNGKKLTDTVTFNPNSMYLWSELLSDSTGHLYSLDRNSSEHRLKKLDNAPVIQPYKSIGYAFTDSTGQLWDGDEKITDATGDTKLKPNQYSGGGSQLYYSNEQGHLMRSYLSNYPSKRIIEDTGITGIPSGQIYPDRNILIADGNGLLYFCTNSYCKQTANEANKNLTPGSWSNARDSQFYPILATGADGSIYLSDGSTWKTVPDLKTEANRLLTTYTSTSSSGRDTFLFTATDGSIWGADQLNYWRTPLNGTVSSSDGSACVVQMPTTGAPNGLATAGLIAMGLGVLGLGLAVRRRRC